MKKFIVLLALLLIGSASYSCDVICPENVDITSPTSRFFSTITGQKALSSLVGEKLIKKAVMKNITSGNIKTDLKAFSVKDLKAGKFKSLEIKGKDVNLQGVYLSSFDLKTLCKYNYVAQNANGDIVIKENMPFSINVVLTEDNINQTMKSSDYKRMIENINGLTKGFKVFNIDSTSAKIKNNQFYYIVKYYIPFINQPNNLVFVSDLNAQNGKIEFENTKILGDSISIDVKHFSKIINYINPLDFSLKVQDNKNAKINIQKVKIVDNKVVADGIITVLKDKE